MSTKYFALLTQLGADKLANAAALGTKIEITHMAVGDGGGKLPTPDTKQTKLINEKRRAAINTLSIDPKNTNQIIAEQVIPENEGGWWIREIGLYDKDGVLIAVGNCAETYKPQLQEGSGRTQTIRMILIVSSANAVTLKVDPSVILATREYVDDSIKKHANSRNHPDATLKEKGFVILSSAVDSNSETHAATPKAVKAAYDLAKAADNNANGRVPAGRKVNGKALSADIALNAADVGAYNTAQTDAKVSEVRSLANTANQNAANANNNANTRLEKNKNGADIPNKDEFVKNLGLVGMVDLAKSAVPNSRKVNGKPLSGDVVINSEDVGAFSRGATTSVQGENGVPWDAASGSYIAQRNGDTQLVIHFNVDVGSTPALQLKTMYRNNGIAYRSARDRYGFEEAWTEFYTTKNKPTANDVDAVSSLHGGTFRDHVRFDKNVIVGNNDNSVVRLSSSGSAVSPVHINLWGNAVQGGGRYTVLEASDNQGWFWFSQRIDNGSVQFAVNGKMLPNDYGNFDSRYLQHHQQHIPVGVPLPWPHANPPEGYFECNGQQFDKSLYPKLATAYPSGTVPDLRGEFVRGLDNGRGADPNRGILTHQEGTIISGFDDNDTGDISFIGEPQYAFGDPMTATQWENTKGKRWIYWNSKDMAKRYDWWAYVSARPRNIAFLYIVRAA
ncbi:phage tail-collar fiber domain-containing protein [Xenorhabdus taiwanensis]|uniref:Tail protein n=1 Tax=Xenorhabdus taiwanensis TaxID=3085177 RepID=A0ABN7C639_9GAMM|nr:hypothetical protein TCT1_27450 [Xenorhabdus sp. TCT-1]